VTLLENPPAANGEDPRPVQDLPALPMAGPKPGSKGVAVALFVCGLGLALVLAVVAYVVAGGSTGSSTAAEDAPSSYGVVIPSGTGKRIASGFHLYLIPEDLQLHVGDTLVVVNDDTQVHEVGPFFVRPGETMRHTFTEPGKYIGACTFHPAGEVSIEVFPVGTPIKAPYLPPQQYN
jgi:plastocyanin